jgi:16S rRNA processing protein RimM
MEIKGHYYLGKILKSIGIDGTMLIYLDVDDPEQYKNLDAVFAFVGGNLVPFLIVNLQLRPGKQAQVKFQDIDNVEQTEVLVSAGLYLPLAALPVLDENQFYFHEIVGFRVVDLEFGEVGIVEKVLEYPKQALLQVLHGKKEVLIPIADEIITKTDKKNRLIHINAPEGLIEMYLE